MKKYIELIDSKAIRKYLSGMDFAPSAFEAAYTVYTSKKLAYRFASGVKFSC